MLFKVEQGWTENQTLFTKQQAKTTRNGGFFFCIKLYVVHVK